MMNFEGAHKSIRKTHGGYDYTPLYRFLLSKIGERWDAVYSEAVRRLDKNNPIFYLVDLYFDGGSEGVVKMGESTHYSKLTVRNGILVKVDENAQPPIKSCTCCTHTFNGRAY
jgi:hypothetical protein